MRLYKLLIMPLFFLLVLIYGCLQGLDMPSKASANPLVSPQSSVMENSEVPQDSSSNQVVNEIKGSDRSDPLKESERYLIKIYRSDFIPNELVIFVNQEVTWQSFDDKIHKIVCYNNSKRIMSSQNLNNGDKFSYRFQDEGTFSCLDAIFGLNGYITVLTPNDNKITGSHIITNEGNSKNSFVPLILFFIFIGLYLYYRVYRKKSTYKYKNK